VSEPRYGLLIESGGKYPIDDFRRDVFVLVVVSKPPIVREELENDAGAIINNLSECWNLDIGDDERKVSIVGVEVIEFVTRWRGRGGWVDMVVDYEENNNHWSQSVSTHNDTQTSSTWSCVTITVGA